MGKKLTKKELEEKKKFHESKASYYKKKIDKIEEDGNRVGFKYWK